MASGAASPWLHYCRFVCSESITMHPSCTVVVHANSGCHHSFFNTASAHVYICMAGLSDRTFWLHPLIQHAEQLDAPFVLTSFQLVYRFIAACACTGSGSGQPLLDHKLDSGGQPSSRQREGIAGTDFGCCAGRGQPCKGRARLRQTCSRFSRVACVTCRRLDDINDASGLGKAPPNALQKHLQLKLTISSHGRAAC